MHPLLAIILSFDIQAYNLHSMACIEKYNLRVTYPLVGVLHYIQISPKPIAISVHPHTMLVLSVNDDYYQESSFIPINCANCAN